MISDKEYFEFIAESLRRPRCLIVWDKYAEVYKSWGVAPISVNRDSDCLERSNWRVIIKDLKERFPDTVDEFRTTHAAVGWMNELMFDARDETTVRAIMKWIQALREHPIADEDDFSELEFEEKANAYTAWAHSDVAALIESIDRESFPSIAKMLDEDNEYAPYNEQEELVAHALALSIYDADTGAYDDAAFLKTLDNMLEDNEQDTDR